MPYLGNVPAEAYTSTVKDSFNGDASTTAFTLSQPSTTNNLRVVVENVIQDPTVAYTVSGTTLTFTSAPPTGTANIYAVHLGPATQTVVPPSEINNATTYTSDLTVQGDLTVDTNTLYVDGANNRVGVGTVSPSTLLHLGGTAPGDSILRQDSTTSGTNWEIGERSAGKWQIWEDDGDSVVATFMSTGKVGIGTTSPNTGLSVVTGSANGIELGQDSDASTDSARLFFSTSAGSNAIHSSSGAMRFFTGSTAGSSTGTERARIDSSGNLLVGTTDDTVYNNSSSGTGINLQNFGNIAVARDGADCMVLNRLNSDGNILLFNKDGSTVGSIGNDSGANIFYFAGPENGIKIVGPVATGVDSLGPSSTTGTNRDNSMDLGWSSNRFDDVYATNGTIQTSDANEKQQIASLTDAEITAAKAISKLFKTFKWNDKVEAKGDAARTHTGVIAQDVEQAMTDAGLDVGNYAFFISTTWWEADETYTDDDGVEQTKTNTYKTIEEAPEGATERNRKGIRYPELLSFIGAATEQRLASIEARLDALENA